MLKKMRHIGVIVEDLDRTIKRFEGFGLRVKRVERSEEESWHEEPRLC